jgi:hypothetical protein
MTFGETYTLGGENYFVMEDGFIEHLRDQGCYSIDINDLFTEFMDWIEDETA